jgi:hypothetical protein
VVRPGISIVNRLYYAYARHALVTALRMARVQPGDTVLIPHFICRDVLSSLRAVDAVPVFYHIDDDFQVASHEKLPSAKAVLAVNYFGFPANLARIQHQLTDATTLIIEDNAHGWLSADEHGVALGTRTSLGITSFRKTIRSIDGAFLEWNEAVPLDFKALHAPLEARKDLLPLGHQVRRLVSEIDRNTPLTLMSIARKTIRGARLLGGKPAIDLRPEEENELPTNRAIHKSSLAMMSRCDRFGERQRRQQAFRQCHEFAITLGIQSPRLQLTPEVSPQGFPFFVHQGDSEAFRRSILRQKLGEIVSWPSLPKESDIPTMSPLRNLRLVNFL